MQMAVFPADVSVRFDVVIRNGKSLHKPGLAALRRDTWELIHHPQGVKVSVLTGVCQEIEK